MPPETSPAADVDLQPAHEHQPDATVLWQRFSVPFEFPVHFTDRIFATENTTLLECICRHEPNKTHRIIVFVDDGLLGSRHKLKEQVVQYAANYQSQIELVCPPIAMPAGEKIKNDLHFVEQMQKHLADHRIDRHSFVIAIGGGALLDAAGLVAATAHRGIRHIRIPTTVLSQNDSGVGVKNSVNLFGQKNYIGTFSPPDSVINDYDFIRSLSARDKTAGMAEAVKVALIRDAAFYRWLAKHADELALFEESAMKHMIRRSAELHMHQIANGGDPFETGSARPLDYGHWAAHKLESMSRYHLRHGEAVAIGLALDTHYSVSCGLLEAGADEEVCFLLEHLGFRLWHSALEARNHKDELEIIQGLKDFQEHLGGQLTITLLSRIGEGIEVNQVDHVKVQQSIQWLKNRAS